jgi:A/G-specific adenine glycosylase
MNESNGTEVGSSRALDPTCLRKRLARWYRSHSRDLPWRRTRDPYSIWLSEIMLQQTTVAAVVPYWERFLGTYPTVASLAAAGEEEVLRLWSGLGYYRRARLLLEAARVVRDDHGGELPRSAEELRRLPGIGEYTAGAIASIAFGEPVIAIDGNVIRVIARLRAIGGDPFRRPASAAVREVASRLLDVGDPGTHNQAMMELGATVCTPSNPGCSTCPWSADCASREEGSPERYPQLAPRRRAVALVRAAALIEDSRSRILLRRIPPGGHNAGLFELPTVTVFDARRHGAVPSRQPDARLKESMSGLLRRELGLGFRPGAARALISHAITHLRITLHVFEGELEGRVPDGCGFDWRLGGEARSLELTAATRRALERALIAREC